MRTAPVVTLVLGLVVGGLVGYRLADGDRPARAAVRTAPEDAEDRESPSTPSAAEAPRVESAPATPSVRPPEARKGTLVVESSRLDPQKFQGVDLSREDMRGESITESIEQGHDDIYRIDGFPATYTVSWFNGEQTRSASISSSGTSSLGLSPPTKTCELR